MTRTLKNILWLVFLFSTFLRSEPLMHFGYRLGGDGIASNYANATGTTKGGYSLTFGINQSLSRDFSLDLFTGYTLDFLQVGTDNKTLMQIPLDCIAMYDAKIVHLGLGLSTTWSSIGTTLEFYPSMVSLPFSLAWVALIEFKLSQDFNYFLGLKTVNIFLSSRGNFENIQESEFYFGRRF